MKKHYQIRVKGIVQGVGFRPFIYQLADQFGINGTVINDTIGVLIQAEAEESILDEFIDAVSEEAPSLSYIQSINMEEHPLIEYNSFTIEKSQIENERIAFYSPDIALCDQCLKEFLDKSNRRYHYPFITCINCGPRLSIINDIPYDRKNTAMDIFPMCPDCNNEYKDQHNRRFHTQPNACEKCGPLLSLYSNSGELLSENTDEIAERTLSYLREGSIVAIKGVGGYHLAVDAMNDSAVMELRLRKNRPFKPFALMTGSIERTSDFLEMSVIEKELLLSKERPVVLLNEKKELVSRHVAPGVSSHGVMLPYTPFHHLLFFLESEMVLIMTSGNLSDEPIIYRDENAFKQLGNIADYIITFNRDILSQSDDSVLFVEKDIPFFIRRSRGYVPLPFASSETEHKILAVGGDLKNCFGFARRDFIILSQYLGDMSDPLTHEAFKKTVNHYIKIFDAEPDTIVSDMHPGYLTTGFADELAGDSVKRINVQHHHAHIASVLEDVNVSEKVIGIAFDGTGYGTDGNLWGSEFLIADRFEFERAGHFSYFALPGGESAIKDVWKIGLSLLFSAFGDDIPVMKNDSSAQNLIEIIKKGINSPLTCSIGRMFDGISSILGISKSISTEAEAAILLEEAALKKKKDIKPFIIPFVDEDKIIISSEELVKYIVSLIKDKNDIEDIAYAFHVSIAHTAVEVSVRMRERTGIDKVALSGGVFHNRILLNLIIDLLEQNSFNVCLPKKVPFNDGCISLGQLSVAKKIIENI